MTPPDEDETLSAADRASVESTHASYERIPYQSNPWTSAQPVKLETIAHFFGLEPAPAARARILEIGCGDGGHLVPLAYAYPDAHFVGLDLGETHIASANAFARSLELSNVRLRAESFVDFEDEAAPFDYVMAHGLMSWITPSLQKLLLETCKRLLAPSGIAFVSYNTYPGWGMQESIREILRHHNRGIDDLDLRIERSVALLDTLLATVPLAEEAYRKYLESVGKIARDPTRRYYFAHEYLEDENHPLYVRDFIERANQAGLGYLGDADMVDVEIDNMPEESSSLLDALVEGPLHRLQVLDFAVNRKFRQSLLCHAEVTLRKTPDLDRAASMYAVSRLGVDGGAEDPAGDAVMSFSDRHGRTIEVDQPLVKAALLRFVEVDQQPIHFDELVDWAMRRLGRSPDRDDPSVAEEVRALALILARIFHADMAELCVSPPCWATAAGARPTASLLARQRAARGEPTTSLRHRTVALDNDLVCEVIQLLDGSRDREAILAHFEGSLPAQELEKILTRTVHNALLLPD
jgi:SAM-dependent methyltransferase